MTLASLKKYVVQLYADAATRTELMKAFKLFDKRGTGRLTRRSIKETAHDIGEKINDEAILEMVQVAGDMQKGYVTQDDFVNFMMSAWSSR